MVSVIPAIVGGLVTVAGSWLLFARNLVTRQEMEAAIAQSPTAIKLEGALTAIEKHDELLEEIRDQIVGLRTDVVRLTTVLEQRLM